MIINVNFYYSLAVMRSSGVASILDITNVIIGSPGDLNESERTLNT